jgi:hypothetical protein
MRLRAATDTLEQLLDRFRSTPSTAPPEAIGAQLNELEAFARQLEGLRPTALQLLASGQPALSQELEALIGRVNYNLETFRFAYGSRSSYAGYLRGQGHIPGAPPSPGPMPAPGAALPGPGTPEWLDAVMGRNCYWCRWSLVGLPQPVAICPNCGRFPKPPGG